MKVKWFAFGILGAAVLAAGGGFVYAMMRINQPQPAVAAHHVTIQYTLVGPDDPTAVKGPDGKTHDTFRAANIPAIHVGDIVTIRVLNYDDVAHGMVFPDLRLSKVIAPSPKDGVAGVTTFTLPTSQACTFRWFCPVPCDTDNNGWAMGLSSTGPGQDGFMAGTVKVA